MRELGFGIYDPSNRAGDGRRSAYRRMTIDDVNELVEFTHQPYMYQRQEQKILKRFHDLGCGIPGELSRSNQQAISVLRFALQAIASWYGKGGEAAKEIMDFAESAGNVSSGEYYRGETYLRFAPDEEIAPSEDCLIGTWLEYKVRVSGSYKNALWSDLQRIKASNCYSYEEFSIDGCLIGEDGLPIQDAILYKGECVAVFRVRDYFGLDKETADMDLLRCRALAGLIDYLATLHLREVELRVIDCVIAHQTNTLIAQAWRVAFEALSEITQRNDKYGHRKLKYRVFCCADCKSPRIVKRGKSAVRCPLCSNNNTKEHKNSKRNVY